MRTTSASKRSITPAIRKTDVPSPNMLFRQQGATRLGFSPTAIPRGSRREGSMGTANFGIAGLDWQQRINWDRLKKYRTERHSPWIPKENIRYSYAWIKGAAGPASQQQVKKFTDAILYEMKRHGGAG